MAVCIKPKFIPQIQDENMDFHCDGSEQEDKEAFIEKVTPLEPLKLVRLRNIFNVPIYSLGFMKINTTLFIFAQIVSENVNTKKLLVYYFKQDDYCIFDGVKDMLMQLLSIELRVVFVDRCDFYGLSILSDCPHIIFIDNLLEDEVISESMTNTVPPNSFVISRGINYVRFSEEMYYPLYKAGKGKDKLEIARWNVIEYWKRELTTQISIVLVKSEADLEEVPKAIKASSMNMQLIIIAKYPDTLKLKNLVQEYRIMDQNYSFVIFTNSEEMTDEAVKQRLKMNLVFTILKDGIWGGEYYVPVENA